MIFRRFYHLARKSVEAWFDDYAASMGAAIAYYTVFSLAPLLIIVIAVAGAVFGREAVEGQIAGQISSLIGVETAMGVQGLIRSASRPASGALATVVSLILLLIGATSVFAELQTALNRIWRVPVAPRRTAWWHTLRARLLSFGLILGLAFLMMVSLIISAAVAALAQWAHGLIPAEESLLQGINFGVSLVITSTMFAMIYKFVPDAKIAWRDVWVGAAVTAVLFELGKIAIGLYLGKSGMTSAYAAAGSLAVLLIWVYYSAQIFLLGAEFTWVLATEHGAGNTDLPPGYPRRTKR
ncbi:MAG: YihY/virulence factor BrkB family protein [Rhodocyclaceae bacterium]|nr:YihY/virulence factor BrkB family protein [Rhodocyclaceae bacterium]